MTDSTKYIRKALRTFGVTANEANKDPVLRRAVLSEANRFEREDRKRIKNMKLDPMDDMANLKRGWFGRR